MAAGARRGAVSEIERAREAAGDEDAVVTVFDGRAHELVGAIAEARHPHHTALGVTLRWQVAAGAAAAPGAAAPTSAGAASVRSTSGACELTLGSQIDELCAAAARDQDGGDRHPLLSPPQLGHRGILAPERG